MSKLFPTALRNNLFHSLFIPNFKIEVKSLRSLSSILQANEENKSKYQPEKTFREGTLYKLSKADDVLPFPLNCEYNQLPILRCRIKKNNTFLTLFTISGNTLGSISSGMTGAKGRKKARNESLEKLSDTFILKMKNKYQLSNVRVVFIGVSPGRLFILKGIYNNDIIISSLTDRTPIYGLGRARKPRRL